MQNRISTSFVQNNFGDILSQVYFDKKQILLTDKGIEIAAIVPVSLMKLLQNIEIKTEINHSEKTHQIKQYKNGYNRFPEKINDIDAWQTVALEVFSEGEW